MEQKKKIEEYTVEDWRSIIEQNYKRVMPSLTVIPYMGEPDLVVTYDYGELVSHCPVTGILDTYRVIIDYIPDQLIPELKSLKFYLLEYEKMRISHEHLASKIYKEFKEQIKPKKLLVRVLTSVRGGIYTTLHIGDMDIQTDINIRKIHG